ncbi:MAG: hypothetical protein ACK5X9_00165 [Alphaproteobacteria bacterium]
MSQITIRTLIAAAEAAATPPSPGRLSALLLEHGTMQLRWFAPKGEDVQTPHDQDELYIIASGTGFIRRVCRTAEPRDARQNGRALKSENQPPAL